MTVSHAHYSREKSLPRSSNDSGHFSLQFIIALAIALSFSLPLLVFMISGEGSRLHVVTSFAALALALALIIWNAPFSIDPLGIFSILMFCFVLFLSIFVNLDGYSAETLAVAIARTCNIFFYLLAGLIIGGSLVFRNIVSFSMKIVSVLLTIILLAGLIYGDVTNVFRPNPFDIHPNWWGEASVATVMAAIAYTSLASRSILTVAPLVMTIYVQSRGALLTIIVFCLLGIFLPYALRRESFLARYALLSCFVIAALVSVAIISIDFVRLNVIQFLQASLEFDTEYRGVEGSIGSRLFTIMKGIETGMDNPVIGVGFANSGLFDNGFDVAAIHNGIVILFSETGVPGVITFSVILMIFAFRWRSSADGAIAVLIALLFMQQAPRFGANIAWSSMMLLWLGWFLGSSTPPVRFAPLAGPVGSRNGSIAKKQTTG